ncbi:MAG: oligosaccharide flippase family protein [Pseudomonadota bacterium]
MLQSIRNVVSNYSLVLLRGLVLLALTPFLVRNLGMADYAAWVILQTIGYYLGFLDFGLSDAQVRQHALLAARGDRQRLARLHETVLTIFLVMGCGGLLVAALLAQLPLSRWLDLPAHLAGGLAPLLGVIAVLNLAQFAEQSLDGLYEGEQRFDRLNLIDAGGVVLEAVLVIAVILGGGGLMALFVVYLGVAAARAIVKYALIPALLPGRVRPRPRFDRASWHSIRSFSLWNALNDVVTEGTAHLDKLLIPVLLTSLLVTPYSLIVLLAGLLFVIAEPLTDTFLPKFSRHADRPGNGALRALLDRGTLLVTLLVVPVAVVLLAHGDRLLAVWIGREYTAVSPAVLVFTVLNFAFSTWLWTAINVLLAVGRIRYVFVVSVGEVAAVLALLLALVPHYGLAGFAAAGFVANVVFGLAFFIPAACAASAGHWPRFMTALLVRPLLAATLAVAAAGGIRAALPEPGIASLLLQCALSGLIAAVLLLLLALPRRQRQRYLITARTLLPGPGRS